MLSAIVAGLGCCHSPGRLGRPNMMSLWSALVVSIRGVSSGEHLIRRELQVHPLLRYLPICLLSC